jgi:hypothetical protein
METVDEQLDRLETHMREELKFQLTVHVPRRYWEDLDGLDDGTNENIKATLRDVFAPWIHTYNNTHIVHILTQCRDVLGYVIWGAMNVPYPQNPDLHIHSVIDNAYNVYVQMTYATLRTEMIMLNHSVQVIQRVWRRCISDPSYEVCQRRLAEEFKTLTRISSM